MKTFLTALSFAILPSLAGAQTENPRGIYKLMSTYSKERGEMLAMVEQYKVCTDSVTLMVTFSNGRFRIMDNDHMVFNHTGDVEYNNQNPKATRVYDGNSKGFKMKWWSTAPSIVFPKDDWCVETYESGQFSDKAKVMFDAYTASPAAYDKSQPLVGTWHMLGMIDELRDLKREMPRLRSDKYSKYAFTVVTPTHMIHSSGQVASITQMAKDKFMVEDMVTFNLKWQSRDLLAVEVKEGYRTDYQIWERVTGDESVMSRVASGFVRGE